MKPHTDTNEGTEILARMDGMMTRVLKVSHPEILRREAEYKAKANMNARKRSPKPKTSSRAADVPPQA